MSRDHSQMLDQLLNFDNKEGGVKVKKVIFEKATDLVRRPRLNSEELVTLTAIGNSRLFHEKQSTADDVIFTSTHVTAAVDDINTDDEDISSKKMLSAHTIKTQLFQNQEEDLSPQAQKQRIQKIIRKHNRKNETTKELKQAIDERVQELQKLRTALLNYSIITQEEYITKIADECLIHGFNGSRLAPALAVAANADAANFFNNYIDNTEISQHLLPESNEHSWSVGSSDFRGPLRRLFQELDGIPRPAGL
uniref:Uncharacterized protein n=1 Tax=Aureoumbra lagunensis TaxID=44058 RepID=A0A7S3NJG5_9STRA|mmetsp:Transcript_15263/g.20209  ORF Transcript_15263/g.20209 Transcript_15263/m.20209 type:complete len:251 (+) Transcript_15263:156-908(+)